MAKGAKFCVKADVLPDGTRVDRGQGNVILSGRPNVGSADAAGSVGGEGVHVDARRVVGARSAGEEVQGHGGVERELVAAPQAVGC